jgi:hypothetical protein
VNRKLSEVTGIEDVADKIVLSLNMAYGVLIIGVAAFGLLLDVFLALIGITIGLVLVIISWMFLKPVKKEGWLYAFIVDIISIPAAYFLLPIEVSPYLITFAVLTIIIMIIPPIRKPYT